MSQFKEAFQLIDQDKDGNITESDLRQLFTSLGITPSEHTLTQLLNSRQGINFPMFLTMMNDRIFQFDPVNDLDDAFACFDDADSGVVKVEELRKWLADVGDRMDQQEIDKFLSGSFTDRHGNFNYREWIKVLHEPQS